MTVGIISQRMPGQVKCCHDTDCHEPMMKKGSTALKMETRKNTKKNTFCKKR